MLAIVDASALIAAADTSEPEHARCVEVLSRRDLYLVLPALAVAEAAYVIERRLGPSAEAAFARGLAGFEIDAPLPVDWPLIADLVERYADFPLGTVDASIAVLADRHRHGPGRHARSTAFRGDPVSRRTLVPSVARTSGGERSVGCLRGAYGVAGVAHSLE